MTAELALEAIKNACLNVKNTEGIILHSDLRSQYTSQLFEGYLSNAEIRHSFSRNCLAALDESGGKDRKMLSYLFRPLTKNKYLSRHRDGSVVILAKGRALFPKIKPLITTGGGATGLVRNLSVSRTAWLLKNAEVESSGEVVETQAPYFVPSACWRKIRPGILSTTRFAGMLMMGKHRLAVYHIGDGTMDWQMKAERSLFYRNYGAYETKATGILLICDNDCGETVARNIIRQTMWQCRQLIHTRSDYERDRPVAYVRAPIRLSWYFEHAYFCECKDLAQRLKEIRDEAAVIAEIRGDASLCDSLACHNADQRVMIIEPPDTLRRLCILVAKAAKIKA